jgi:phospholipase D1/2
VVGVPQFGMTPLAATALLDENAGLALERTAGNSPGIDITIADYFVPSSNPADDLLFTPPTRSGITVIPLVDGVAAFQAMEKAIANAQQTVHLSLWIFNPATQLQAGSDVNKILKRRGVKKRVGTWADLLATVAGLGAHVRVILNDFDPILKTANHANNWRAYLLLQTAGAARGKGRLEIMVSMHDARATGLLGLASAVLLPKKLNKILTELNAAGPRAARARMSVMPRLWPFVALERRTGRLIEASSPTWEVCPAAHHQKLLVVDQVNAFCGGLDINRGRLADPTHLTRLWHDADVQVDGQVAADLDRNFYSRWNHEGAEFNAFLGIQDPWGSPLPAVPVARPVAMPSAAVPGGTGPAVSQIWRTLSRKEGSPDVPKNLLANIRDGYRKAIGQAIKFIYIENQYVRAEDLASWLIDRRDSHPDLVVLIVLPVAPEEVSEPGGVDDVTDLGLHLQHGILTDLRDEFRSNLGLYSMAARSIASKRLDSDAINRSRQIYVHTKAMIIDDVWATVGSANITPRSFLVDTEANIAWHHPMGVRAFRLTLWREILGSPKDIASWKPSEFVPKWDAIAKANETRKTLTAVNGRQGFVVPHDPTRFEGHSHPLIPDEFTELVDTDPEPEFTA